MEESKNHVFNISLDRLFYKSAHIVAPSGMMLTEADIIPQPNLEPAKIETMMAENFELPLNMFFKSS